MSAAEILLAAQLEQAVRWNAIARNPAAAVKAPRPAKREMRFLDTHQVRAMLDAIEGDPLEPLYVAAVFTGMRIGELLALRWRDVDLDGSTIAVVNTLTRDGGEWILRQPKTPHSRRTIRQEEDAVPAIAIVGRLLPEQAVAIQAQTVDYLDLFLLHGCQWHTVTSAGDAKHEWIPASPEEVLAHLAQRNPDLISSELPGDFRLPRRPDWYANRAVRP